MMSNKLLMNIEIHSVFLHEVCMKNLQGETAYTFLSRTPPMGIAMPVICYLIENSRMQRSFRCLRFKNIGDVD